MMKAMIFAAGLGTRLKPLTDTMPKAMVPIAGKPLLQHTIEKLKQAGINEVIINVHHFANQIIDFVRANNSFGIGIEFSDEREKLLDTGGAIKKAAWFFEDGKPFLVHNVDIVSDIDLHWLLEWHRKNHAMATLICSPRETTRYLLFDERKRLKGWVNEKTGAIRSPFDDFDPSLYQKLAFSGIHVMEPTIIDHMHDWPDKFSIIDFYLNQCDKHPFLAAVPTSLRMMDVGKPEALKEAEQFLM